MSQSSGRIFHLAGRIDPLQAVVVKTEVERFIDDNPNSVEVRLDELDSHSSVIVGLMMGWMRHAHRQGKTIVFSNLPAQLLKIIEFSGLTETMPLIGDKPC